MTRSYEAYEDQGGTLYIFALEAYRPVWAASWGMPDRCESCGAPLD